MEIGISAEITRAFKLNYRLIIVLFLTLSFYLWFSRSLENGSSSLNLLNRSVFCVGRFDVIWLVNCYFEILVLTIITHPLESDIMQQSVQKCRCQPYFCTQESTALSVKSRLFLHTNVKFFSLFRRQ